MSIYKQNIDPIALTEADADAFLRDMDITLYEDTMVIEGTEYEGTYGEEVLAENGIFLYDDGIVLEGKQAEEYLKRKKAEKEEKERSKQEDEKRYGKNWRNYQYYGEKRYTDGTRSQDAKIDYNGREVDYSKDGEHYRPEFKSRRNTSLNNPRFDKARELESHRLKYGDVMPIKMTKAEREYNKAKQKDAAAKEYAHRVASKYLSRERKAVGGGSYSVETPEYARVADAARRHYRKTHKNESTIFSDIEII